MFQNLADRPDPLIYFIVVFPLALLALAIGYYAAARFHRAEDDRAGWAFGLGQAAIFALIALMFGFSFSFAAGRYEARRSLVVSEADAISNAYLRGGFLPAANAARFRETLVEYTQSRLATYGEIADAAAERRELQHDKELQERLWVMAAGAARRDPHSPFYTDLTRSVLEVIDVAEQQAAALNDHVPRAILGIVLLSAIVGALLLGLTFGRARAPHPLLAVIFCLLFSATVFTIVDLDHPQGGFTGVDITPLRSTLNDMTSHAPRAIK